MRGGIAPGRAREAADSVRGLPRLHLITNDEVIGAVEFMARAMAVLEVLGAAVALHLRAHDAAGGALYGMARPLAAAAEASGALLIVNDRVDVALAVGCGAQLGRRSIPVAAARALLGPGVVLGYSAHEAGEAVGAAESGADLLVLGTIWPSASHPGRDGAGPSLVAAVAAAVAVPVLAIGGVTPARARDALQAGAHGVAVLTGVWASPDPVAAATAYLDAMGGAAHER
jgi:thiamine-phosphate diphosphorylase